MTIAQIKQVMEIPVRINDACVNIHMCHTRKTLNTKRAEYRFWFQIHAFILRLQKLCKILLHRWEFGYVLFFVFYCCLCVRLSKTTRQETWNCLYNSVDSVVWLKLRSRPIRARMTDSLNIALIRRHSDLNVWFFRELFRSHSQSISISIKCFVSLFCICSSVRS